MRAALSEMTKNMGDSWGRTPERGHIHQLYCHPPFFQITLPTGQHYSSTSRPSGSSVLSSSREVQGEKKAR